MVNTALADELAGCADDQHHLQSHTVLRLTHGTTLLTAVAFLHHVSGLPTRRYMRFRSWQKRPSSGQSRAPLRHHHLVWEAPRDEKEVQVMVLTRRLGSDSKSLCVAVDRAAVAGLSEHQGAAMSDCVAPALCVSTLVLCCVRTHRGTSGEVRTCCRVLLQNQI